MLLHCGPRQLGQAFLSVTRGADRDLPSPPSRGWGTGKSRSAVDGEGASGGQCGEHWLDPELRAGRDLSLVHPAETCQALSSAGSVPSL